MRKVLEHKPLICSVLLAVLYFILAWLAFHKGIYSREALFYTEKSMIIFGGTGDRLIPIGLTYPPVPFYITIPFQLFGVLFAPYLASALGMAVLFYIIALQIDKLDGKNNWLFAGLFLTFLLHPGVLYAAASGRSIYLTLIFFFLFFISILRYFKSNTSYHISIASIFFTLLIFCHFKFSWIALFLLPITFFIALNSLNLQEVQPTQRMSFAFNNLSVRRKLINKTFAIYIIVFLLPLSAIVLYRLLNFIHTGNYSYFSESLYASYRNVIELIESSYVHSDESLVTIPETGFLTSLRAFIYAPLLLLVIRHFSNRSLQLLTLFAPLAFIEFLKLKYPSVYLTAEFYLIFIVICFGAFIFSGRPVKYLFMTFIVIQLFTGAYSTYTSFVPPEQNFFHAFLNKPNKAFQTKMDENSKLASFIRQKIKPNDLILADDATAYPVVAMSKNIDRFLLPYQSNFVSALEAPQMHVKYLLVNNDSDPFHSLNLINSDFLRQYGHEKDLELVYKSDVWNLYYIRINKR